MIQFGIVWRKEMLESWTNRKWIWLPLVFILLGAMQPVSTYFMPQILKMSGGLPAGTVIHIPTPSPEDVFAKAQSQYNSLGLLVLVLAFMGGISNERQQRVLELVLVKPVSYASYIMAKWLSAIVLTLAGLILGDLAAWYYTVQLIGPLSIWHILAAMSVYVLWLVLIVTLTTFLSVILNSAIANAFVTLLSAAVLSLVAGLLKWSWSPGALPSDAASIVTHWGYLGTAAAGQSYLQLFLSLALTGVIVIALLGSSIYGFQRKTFA